MFQSKKKSRVNVVIIGPNASDEEREFKEFLAEKFGWRVTYPKYRVNQK